MLSRKQDKGSQQEIEELLFKRASHTQSHIVDVESAEWLHFHSVFGKLLMGAISGQGDTIADQAGNAL